MNKLENWMDNLKEPALKQALRFILETKKDEDILHNIGFIKSQINEFANMYPMGE